jgi:GTP-binding protein
MTIKVLAPQFVYSSPKVQLMQDFGLEMTVIGRSNSGKSSLINALTQKKDLAKTSKTPGRTRHAVVYRFQLRKVEQEKTVTLVDLPGFGYANMSKTEAAACEKLIFDYLEERPQLKLICLLLDIRRKPDARERYIVQNAVSRGIKLIFVMTKCDKLSLSQRKPMQGKTAKELGLPVGQVMLHSQDIPEQTEKIMRIVWDVF